VAPAVPAVHRFLTTEQFAAAGTAGATPSLRASVPSASSVVKEPPVLAPLLDFPAASDK